MARNGKHFPPRPRLEIVQSAVAATPPEAAAITAAIEQFLRDTTPPPAPREPRRSGWQRAGLFEGVGMPADSSSVWG